MSTHILWPNYIWPWPWPSRSNCQFHHKISYLTFKLPVKVKGQWSKTIAHANTHPMNYWSLTLTLTFKVKLPISRCIWLANNSIILEVRLCVKKFKKQQKTNKITNVTTVNYHEQLKIVGVYCYPGTNTADLISHWRTVIDTHDISTTFWMCEL